MRPTLRNPGLPANITTIHINYRQCISLHPSSHQYHPLLLAAPQPLNIPNLAPMSAHCLPLLLETMCCETTTRYLCRNFHLLAIDIRQELCKKVATNTYEGFGSCGSIKRQTDPSVVDEHANCSKCAGFTNSSCKLPTDFCNWPDG